MIEAREQQFNKMNLTELPEGILEVVARHLAAKDLFNFLSVHRTFRCLGLVPKFWIALRDLHYPTLSTSFSFANALTELNEERHDTNCLLALKKAKDAYLMCAHCDLLPQVRWYAIAESVRTPCPREGHLACRMGNFIVLTGGFTQDMAIYVKDIRNNNEDWLRVLPDADSHRPEWVYGASLTALDKTRAIRFGGFRQGGYSDETCQVAILHLTVAATNESFTTSSVGPQLRARWEIIRCQYGITPMLDVERGWYQQAARAYHASILLHQRYLLVIGGMQSRQSILHPMILDTQTWTWHSECITTDAGPSPRHGCSLVYDAARNQLVLFGGGSGNDLLRSGIDFAEVWELDMHNATCHPDSTETQTPQRDLLSTIPWTWRLRHDLTVDNHAGEERDSDSNTLSTTEILNLGRCHGCYHVSNDTCLLAFGSGRPSNNSILGYRLKTKEFFRPIVQGPFPRDRFTFASVHLLELGYIVFHGGYSSRLSDTVSGMCVLDLAPGMQRPFQMWSVDQNARSHYVLTAEEIAVQQRWRQNQNRFERLIGHISSQIINYDNEGDHSTDGDYSDNDEDYSE